MKKTAFGLLVLCGAAAFGLLLFWTRSPTLSAGPTLPISNPSVEGRLALGKARDEKAPVLTAAAGSRNAKFSIAEDGTVSLPPRFRFPGVDRVRTASSTGSWMALFPVGEQKLLKDFSEKYQGVYQISSAQQIAWMAENGYLMPEDVIAAQGFSDKALRDLAKGGNEKASMLLRDRVVGRVGKSFSKLDMSNPEDVETVQILAESENTLRRSNSPFKGFVQAAEASISFSDPAEQKAVLISGLLRAQLLGDVRAFDVLDSYTDSVRGMNDGIISETEFTIASRIAMDAFIDTLSMAREDCPGPVKIKMIPHQRRTTTHPPPAPPPGTMPCPCSSSPPTP